MQAREEPVLVNEFEVGLDRAKITDTAQIELNESHSSQDQSAEVHAEPDSPRSSSSAHHVVDSIKLKKHKAGIKIRKTLHIGKASDDLDHTTTALVGAAEEPSGSRYATAPPEPEKATVKDFIHNPIDTVKAKVSEHGNQQVASQITAKEIPHGDEVDLLRASEAVEDAQNDVQRLLAIQDLSKLMKERQAKYARWTLDRHISKVRLLPREQIRLKPRSDFERYNPQEGLVIDWKAYTQHVSQAIISILLEA
jgi:hypothetical protein